MHFLSAKLDSRLLYLGDCLKISFRIRKGKVKVLKKTLTVVLLNINAEAVQKHLNEQKMWHFMKSNVGILSVTIVAKYFLVVKPLSDTLVAMIPHKIDVMFVKNPSVPNSH